MIKNWLYIIESERGIQKVRCEYEHSEKKYLHIGEKENDNLSLQLQEIIKQDKILKKSWNIR